MTKAVAATGAYPLRSASTHLLPLRLLLLLPLLSTLLTTIRVQGVDLSNCRKSLGMQSGAIPDSAISASSSYDNASVGPSNARIRTERNGGAWCPKAPITRDSNEWIEIDLQELKVITQVETQGRFGNGQGQEYAEAYMLRYQRLDGGPWIKFKDRKGNEVFAGNGNTYIAELREINPPIIARKVRIQPHSIHPRTVCMRVELYGCLWRDGVLSYSMPQGEKRGTEVDLFDFTYDGTTNEVNQTNGLGQLTDGVEGHSNFRLDLDNYGKKGYEWVGWKNETVDRPPIEIVFEFDKVRNFSAARFHCNNMFSKEVRVFQKALLHFSVSGIVYQENPVVYKYTRDTLIEFARNVIIPIKQKIGRFVKVELYFDAKWMMISEVRFESEVASGNYSEELLPGGHSTLGPSLATQKSGTKVRPEEDDLERPAILFDDQLTGIIVGALGALVLLLIGVVIFCIVYRRQRSKYNNGGGKIAHTQQQVSLKFQKPPIPSDVGTPSRKVSNGNTYSNVVTCDTDIATHDTLSSKALLFTNGDTYRQPHDVIQTRRLPELPRIPVDSADYLSDTNTSTYAVPDIAYISTIGANNHSLFPRQTPSPSVLSNLYDQDPNCAPTLLSSLRQRSLHGSRDPVILQHPDLEEESLYATAGHSSHLAKDDLTIIEFPRENLKFLEKLGEGLFGEVHLCEAVRIQDVIGDDFLLNRMNKWPMLVAVKVLCKAASVKSREDFYKEVRIMSRLKDPNIVSLLGVCTQEEPFCVVVEYMKYGDLNQFLQLHVASESSLARNLETKTLGYLLGLVLVKENSFQMLVEGACSIPSKKKVQIQGVTIPGTWPNHDKVHITLSKELVVYPCYGCLIYMATQIASGMKFLEKLNVIHRDLATRNCLVGHQYTIKISDFGMSRSLYSADYYRIEGKAVLPIRWMAWESVLLGKFSTKSDVWSFGIALWEILTFAREQPFDGLSDEQVIENCGHYYHGDQQQICLTQPPNCPKEIYDLMVECWNRDQTQRPEFREIHMFLERKNRGYNPQDERQALLQNAAPSFV